MKKLGVSLLLLGLLSTGCANISAPAQEKVEIPVPEPVAKEQYILPFTLPFDPTASFHPCLVDSQLNMDFSSLMYESLYQVNQEFKAEKVLVAEESVSENGLQWVFTLKEDIFFWDGTVLTGKIVASALNEAKGNLSRYAPRFENIRSITGTDTQVTVNLIEPNYLLPTLLDIPISYGGGTYPLGTGAYEYVEESSKLVKHTLWWQEKEVPDTVILMATTKEEDLISAFDAGELSLLDGDLTTSQVLGYSGNYQVWEYGNPRLFYLGVAGEWGGNQKTLLTLSSQVIDRELLVDKILAGYGVATEYLAHPHSELGQALPQWEYNPMLVEERLNQLASVSYPVTLTVHENNVQKVSLAEEIAEILTQYGLRISVEKLSWENYVNALESGDFQLFVGEMYLTPDFNVGELLTTGGTFAYGRSGDTQIDFLWQEYRRYGLEVLEGEENFFTYVQEEMSIIPLFFKNGTMLSVWGHLEVASPVAGNLFYRLEDWVFRK